MTNPYKKTKTKPKSNATAPTANFSRSSTTSMWFYANMRWMEWSRLWMHQRSITWSISGTTALFVSLKCLAKTDQKTISLKTWHSSLRLSKSRSLQSLSSVASRITQLASRSWSSISQSFAKKVQLGIRLMLGLSKKKNHYAGKTPSQL